ncbi:hypothetical protein BB558_000426 [Smittium angustum]|uniref:Uncharacterized protein n=1 Tax=Smittium angustum TaxID=133377 RepID=A0A2U1JE95_SMIAN|nr:hypothetical protein BB558_000426 [Smittium angustum]
MAILDYLTNFAMNTPLKLYNKIGFGLPLASFFMFLAEILYPPISKIPIGESPQTRFNKYVNDYNQKKKTDIEQKIAIVTGANSGIGYETTKALMLTGHIVVMACRNETLAKEAIADLEKETGIKTCEFIHLDLSSISSCRKFAAEFKKKHNKLHLLINNAGIMACPYMTTKDGIEMQFGTNHVGHFVITTELLDTIKASAPARIINVSSMAHASGDFNKEKILDKSKYQKVGNYGISKLANIMFTNSLAKKLEGTGVTANSLHPGTVYTKLQRHIPGSSSSIQQSVTRALFLSPTAGSLTTLLLALSDKVEGVTGKYFMRELEATTLSQATNQEKCDELWEFTEELIGKSEMNSDTHSISIK